MASLWQRVFGPLSRGAVVPPVGINVQATAAGQQSSTLPVTQSLVSTAETQILAGPTPTLPLSCAMRPSRQYEQVRFQFEASGLVTTTASGNVTISIYAGVSTTIGSNTLLKASTATAQNSKTESWYVSGSPIYNSVSGTLTGTFKFLINNTATAEAVLTNVPTGISDTGDPVVQFSMTATSSGAGSGTPTTFTVANFSCG